MIEPTADGVVLTVRVIPRGGRAGIAGTRGDALLVRLQSPPVDGAANAELVSLLADRLDVSRRSVSIVSGERSRTKRIRISGVTVGQVEALAGIDGRERT